jgi:putative copper export protein/copper(I)-binding protein/mono/diheme cytochrome c family protein
VADALIAVRTVHVAASVAAVGAILFRLWVAAPALRAVGAPVPWGDALDRQVACIAWASLAVVIVSAAAWLVLVAADVSGRSLGDVLGNGVLSTVLTSTRFGHVWIARVAIALALGVYLLRAQSDVRPFSVWGSAAAALAAALLGVLALAGHGGATAGAAGIVHLAGDAVHAIAAGVWVGALLPLALLLAAARRAAAAAVLAAARDATRRFSTLGLISVATLLATGIVNTIFLAGSVPALLGTTYGQLLLVKIVLFVAMVGIAAVNRLKLTPELSTERAAPALPRLQRNASIEAGLGLAILAIVGALGAIPPALHVEPRWPLPFRLDLDALTAPELQISALLAAIAAAILAASAIAAACSRRRRRAATLAALIALACLFWNVRFLAVPAFPTSFYRSPTNFTFDSIARGHELFGTHCAGCHGATGRGDGPNAHALDMAPSDVTAAHIYAHADGDLYWWIGHGVGDTMPGFGAAIDDKARWNLIDFIHANADAARLQRRDPHGPNAFPAPTFTAECAGGGKAVEDLHGSFVRLVVTDGARPPAADANVATIIVPLDAAHEAPGECVVDEPDTLAALAVYRGDAALAGTQFLIDPEGRLRAMWHPGLKLDWNDPDTLAREIARLRNTPAVGRPSRRRAWARALSRAHSNHMVTQTMEKIVTKASLIVIACLATGFVACPWGASAQEVKVGDLRIEHPWARATPKGAKVGAGYLTITNNGSTPDRLVGGSSQDAGTVEVHEMVMKDNVMTMRRIAGGLSSSRRIGLLRSR